MQAADCRLERKHVNETIGAADKTARYRETLLKQLVEAYRKSKKDTGTNLIRRKTKLSPVKLYRDYRKNDGDFDEIEALNDAVRFCCEEGYVSCTEKAYSSEIDQIILNDERVSEIEAYLTEHCGYRTKAEQMREIDEHLRLYEGKTPAAAALCRETRKTLDQNRIPAHFEQTEQILKALVLIERNRQELYLREASMLIYGSSKFLEENTLDTVCRLLRKELDQPCEENELPDEILSEYHIIREKQKLCLKGDLSIHIRGREIPVGCLPDGIELYADDLRELERIELGADRLLTVENKTSYFRSREEGAVTLYLGGYANRSQRDFLIRLAAEHPGLRYAHFGDIDAGGFYIHRHLCRMTGLPFEMRHMSVKELQNPAYQSSLQPLTARDRQRLRELASEEPYAETASYMLEHNVKLEQEIISYTLYPSGRGSG